MAHLNHILPDLTADELAWFDKCPKAVLFEIARQFGMRVADEFTAEAGFEIMVEEWKALHANGIVPQKPFDPMASRAKRQSRAAQAAEKARNARLYLARQVIGSAEREAIFRRQYGVTARHVIDEAKESDDADA